MRRNGTAKKASERGNVSINIKARQNTPLRLIKQLWRPTKIQTGRGLGKAGARRLGRLLKRTLLDQEELGGKGQGSVPKTPIRLFKHQIQSEADNASETMTASRHVSQLILSMVTQCKHRGGISMAELKQTLAAKGYDVTRNNKRVNTATKRLVDTVTLVRTTRNALLTKKKTDTPHVKTIPVTFPKPKGNLKQSKAATKSPEGKRQHMKTPEARGKSRRLKKKTRRAAKTRKPKGNTRKLEHKSQKQKGRTHKPAGRSHKSTRRTIKARKMRKPAGKKRRPLTNHPTQVRKAARKARRPRRRQPKRNQQAHRFSQKRPQRRRVKTQQRQTAKRRAYYY